MSEEQRESGLDKWLEQRHGIKKRSVTEAEVISHRIVILVEPVPVDYIKTRYAIVPSGETVKFQNAVRLWIRPYAGLVRDKTIPIFLRTWFYFRPPKDIAKLSNLPPHVRKPDRDNLDKSFTDCLKTHRKKIKGVWTVVQEGMIPDDNQINHSETFKAYTRRTPRIVMILSYPKPKPQPIQEELNYE